jgi:DNA-binding CsgD family transcriptional regulator
LVCLVHERVQAVQEPDGAARRGPARHRHEPGLSAAADYVVGGPIFSPSEWTAALATHRFHGEAEVMRADGTTIGVQWGGATEVATGRRLVLFVALSTSRWGGSFRRSVVLDHAPGDLSMRELEIVRLIAHGESGPEIAAELHISHDTVRTHVRNAMRKVGARSRAHLVAKVLGEGYALA